MVYFSLRQVLEKKAPAFLSRLPAPIFALIRKMAGEKTIVRLQKNWVQARQRRLATHAPIPHAGMSEKFREALEAIGWLVDEVFALQVQFKHPAVSNLSPPNNDKTRPKPKASVKDRKPSTRPASPLPPDNPTSLPSFALHACNHPLGALDGLSLAAKLYQKGMAVKFIANDLLSEIDPIGGAVVPVSVFGYTRPSVIKNLKRDTLNKGLALITFPAGKVARKIEGVVTDSMWSARFIDLCLSSGRDLVLVHCRAENSRLFYLLHSIRTKLSIQTNLEMFLLPHSFFSGKKKAITFHFSLPLRSTEIKALIQSLSKEHQLPVPRIKILLAEAMRDYSHSKHFIDNCSTPKEALVDALFRISTHLAKKT